MPSYENESKYRDAMADGLRNMGWDVQRHEDSCFNYIPDLSFAGFGKDGWIEVKFIPKLGETINIPHFTPGQRSWLVARGRSGGGLCFLLVGSPADHWVFHFTDGHDLIDIHKMPIADARRSAWLHHANPANLLSEFHRRMVTGFSHYHEPRQEVPARRAGTGRRRA